MKPLILQRCLQYPTSTFGILVVNNEPKFVTIEKPWLNNERNISCIPIGTYTAKPHNSPTFGKTLLVEGVKDRDHILIHAGNTSADTKGCILIGTEFGGLNGMRAILKSRVALRKLLSIIEEPTEFIVRVGFTYG